MAPVDLQGKWKGCLPESEANNKAAYYFKSLRLQGSCSPCHPLLDLGLEDLDFSYSCAIS
jgi:hypothetical protein